jgi:hypothetical protein
MRIPFTEPLVFPCENEWVVKSIMHDKIKSKYLFIAFRLFIPLQIAC